MYNIVTSICVDQDKFGKNIKYPNLGNEKNNRRFVYWRCVYTFCATSIRVNPEKNHLVITNDHQKVVIDGIDIKEKLLLLGAKIVYLDFDKYDPGSHSVKFRNAFYKLQTIERLSQENLPSILLDSDILWHKKDPILDNVMESGEYLVLQDTYQRSDQPLSRIPHNISMKDMGEVYQSIKVLNYKQPYPVWYGGELIGGSPNTLKRIASDVLVLLNYCKDQDDKGNRITFPNGSSIFDGDEYITSFIYNSLDLEIYDTCNRHSKRFWTIESPNNVLEGDENIPIWHVTGEKVTGLKEIFYESINPESDFWKTTNFTEYLGKFIGIPKRIFKEKSTMDKIKASMYDQLRFLNKGRKKAVWLINMSLNKIKK